MSVRIIQGDVREELPKLPADYFDCIVTSPPYYGLRDYGTATWEGGDPSCDHKLVRPQGPSTLNSRCGQAQIDYAAKIEEQYRLKCGKCGARRIDSQIGLEPTLEEYLETMVAVCRELRRVLKPSGVFFLNIGDSYSSQFNKSDKNVYHERTSETWPGHRKAIDGFKPKDLCLVPERLGIALQADGWWVRSHIIWAKPNPMPESVTDRPTSAHETIWMLTKSARYFWDAEAVKEDASTFERQRSFGKSPKTIALEENGTHGEGGNLGIRYDRQARNLRNVWPVASHPFSQAHFATMPPDIVERCIKAGSSERGCCPACGAPWARVVDVSRRDTRPNHKSKFIGKDTSDIRMSSPNNVAFCLARRTEATVDTIGWQPSCKCQISDSIPARILDPFAGAGTTGLVADRLGRDATLIDLNTSYIDMAVNRIRDDAPLFAEVAAE